MNICLQLLLYVTVATKQERHDMREYWKFRRATWIKRNIIDDHPLDENGREIIPKDDDEL